MRVAGEATQECRSKQHTRQAVVSIHRPDVPNYEELLVPVGGGDGGGGGGGNGGGDCGCEGAGK